MHQNYKVYHPYVSPFDPCPPIKQKVYSTPPNLYMGFQPANLEQFTPREALRNGTLWKAFYDPYYSPYELNGDGDS
ncbi:MULTISPECIES: spore coat associated protein CotJA [Rossellomorea]|uniref:spore coat associated protein CotJA n=1 Tax=Rossellomorea TaxID=2837508 RepID=UPI001CC9213E|nr:MULTISPECIES: spore coat associated protein CotJA [Rossellomorea]MCA0149576.1 spore coat associated protein CotJA [Rossellomorea vietnamensis]WGG46624.1 spore coat associated protein CotJA [Rossellomorea sp. DA94]